MDSIGPWYTKRDLRTRETAGGDFSSLWEAPEPHRCLEPPLPSWTVHPLPVEGQHYWQGQLYQVSQGRAESKRSKHVKNVGLPAGFSLFISSFEGYPVCIFTQTQHKKARRVNLSQNRPIPWQQESHSLKTEIHLNFSSCIVCDLKKQ